MLLQVTARWGPDVIGVWRVDSRDGFVFDDVVVMEPSESWSESSAAKSPYRDTGVDVSFAIERLEARWGRSREKWRAASVAAAIVSVVLHTGFAFAASHAHAPSEEEASVMRLAFLMRISHNADEREQEERDALDDDQCAEGCMSGPFRWTPLHRFGYFEDEPIHPAAPEWCGGYGEFWMTARECVGPPTNDALAPALSTRVMIDALGARIAPNGPPRVRATIVTKGAGDHRSVIGREIRVMEPKLARCYENTLAFFDPDREAQMNARYTIRPDGTLARLALDGGFPSDDFDLCAYRVMLQTRFPPHEGDPIEVRYSIAFTSR